MSRQYTGNGLQSITNISRGANDSCYTERGTSGSCRSIANAAERGEVAKQ